MTFDAVPVSTAAAPGRGRREEILDAAGRVLLRHGFRKASVDEVARVAQISRQGVYLHFGTKDELFAAAIEHLLASSVGAARAELADGGAPLDERILAAFEAIAGDAIDARLDEVLETAERLTGRTSAELEGEIISEFAAALASSPASSPWRRLGDDADEVALLLYATSAGLKRIAKTVPEYLAHLQRAIELVCAEAPTAPPARSRKKDNP